MGDIIDQAVLAVLEAIFEFVLYWTARLLLPLVSLGRWDVMALRTEFVLWQGPSFQRSPDGKVIVGASMAALFGLLFWVAAGVTVAAIFAHKG